MPVELLKIIKDDAVKVPHSIFQQIWKTQQWPQDWKRSVFIPISKKDNSKECSNYYTVVLISRASKVMVKILQAGLQLYVNRELPDLQAGFWRDRGTRDQTSNICWTMGKTSEFKKTSTSVSLIRLKPLTVWIITNWKLLKRWEYQNTLHFSCETWMWVKKQPLELDMEQQTGAKYCHPGYLTYMQSMSWKMPGWKNRKLESRMLGQIATALDMQVIPL